MHKRFLILIIAGLIAFMFWHDDVEKYLGPNEKLKDFLSQQSDDVNAWNIDPSKEDKSLATQAQPQETTKSKAELDELETPKQCYSKVDAQVASNHSYIDYNRENLNQVVGEWFYERNPREIDSNPSGSKQDKFFRALAKANLLGGITVEQNDSEALALLKEVAKEDPQNSAPLIYASIIQHRRGNKTASEKLLALAEKTSRYDNYFKDFTRALYARVEEPADLIKAINVYSTLPFPETLAIGKAIQHSENLNKQMASEALKHESNPYELNWSLLDYVVARSNLKKMGKAADFPDWRELSKKTTESSDEFLKKLLKNCDLDDLKSEVQKVKSILGKTQ